MITNMRSAFRFATSAPGTLVPARFFPLPAAASSRHRLPAVRAAFRF